MTGQAVAPAWWRDLAAAVEAPGFRLAGGFHPEPGEDAADATLVVVGHAGPLLWESFAANRPTSPNPLDDWTRATLTPIAAAAGGRLMLPNDGPPWPPFQRWAMRAEAVHPSPLGLLIHREHGLWHALRAAIAFPDRRALPQHPPAAGPAPCVACAGRPCLTACPVDAFDAIGFAAARCAAHLRSPEGADCRSRGCLARRACPVGRDRAWGDDQQAFHMAAFLEAVG